MLLFLVLLSAIIAVSYFFLGKNDTNKPILFKKSIGLFAIVFSIVFLLWLLFPTILFESQKQEFLTQILTTTGIPPTIAKLIATVLALIFIVIVWKGGIMASPMNLVYAGIVPTIFFLVLQFFYPNVATGCIAFHPAAQRYESCDCEYLNNIHSEWGTPIIKNKGQLSPVNADEKTPFFAKDGTPLYYYTEDQNSKIFIFDQQGTTPQGYTTQPVTREIVRRYLNQISQQTSQQQPTKEYYQQPNVEQPTQTTETSVPQYQEEPKQKIQEQAYQPSPEPSRYVNLIANPSFVNLPNSQEIVVVAVNGNNQIESGLASQIAATFKNKGYRATSAFFKSSFVGDGHFEDMYQDGQELVQALGLSNYADKVCLVKYHVKTRPNDYGQTTADASLQIHVLSTSNGKVNDSISLTESGFGFTEFEAKNTVIQKLIQQLSLQL